MHAQRSRQIIALLTLSVLALTVLVGLQTKRYFDVKKHTEQSILAHQGDHGVSDANAVTILRVDGIDRIVVSTTDGQQRTVSLVGLKALFDGECGADAALTRLRTLAAEGTSATLVQDLNIGTQAVNGALPRYLYVGSTDVGGALVLEGLVDVSAPEGPLPMRFEQYSGAARYASSRGMGSWSKCSAPGH